MFAQSEMILIRHARAATEGRLAGRRDVGLEEGSEAALAALAKALTDIHSLYVSPALRCRLTAEALWPDAPMLEDSRLWEQDFGDWEGRPFDSLPDHGTMSRSELLDFAPPGGESFRAMQARIVPALKDIAGVARHGDGPVAVVAHAGVVRVALSLALASPAQGLAFEVDPLSVTGLRCLPDGAFSIARVNWSLS